jgi:hypothetical protein
VENRGILTLQTFFFGCAVNAGKLGMTGRREAAIKTILTLIMVGGLVAAWVRAEAEGDAFSRFLEKHNAVVTVDSSAGYTDNVYLMPRNEESDAYIDLYADIEMARELGEDATVYLYGLLERKQFLGESDADETFADISGEYVCTRTAWRFGVSDVLSYENYRSFDEEAGTLPSDKYESVANRARGFGAYLFNEDHVLEAGLALRMKNYTSTDFDFNETGFDLVYAWEISPVLRAKLLYESLMQDYSDYQALSVDGTLTEANPALELDRRRIQVEAVRKLPRAGDVKLFIRRVDAEESFDGEGDYSETGYGGTVTVAIGERYAAEGALSVYRRDYDRRLVSAGTSVQKDDFMTLAFTVERQLQGTLSAFCKVEISSHDSDDSADGYDENALSVGIRAVL